MSTAVIAVEGVLGDSPHFDITMQRSVPGFELFHALGTTYRRVLVTDHPDHGRVAHWLAVSGYRGYDMLLTGSAEALDTAAQRTEQLRGLRSSRTTLSLVVDTEPAAVDYASRTGTPGLLWVPPRRGVDRDDLQPRPIRSWEEMSR